VKQDPNSSRDFPILIWPVAGCDGGADDKATGSKSATLNKQQSPERNSYIALTI
jgi:hypothetical protein